MLSLILMLTSLIHSFPMIRTRKKLLMQFQQDCVILKAGKDNDIALIHKLLQSCNEKVIFWLFII